MAKKAVKREDSKKGKRDYFKKGKISRATYNIKMDKFNKRLAEIKHTIPVM